MKDTYIGDVPLLSSSILKEYRHIQGSVMRVKSDITSLPKTLESISGNLNIKYTAIKDISWITIGGILYCDEEFIQGLPVDRLPFYLKYNKIYDGVGHSFKSLIARRLRLNR